MRTAYSETQLAAARKTEQEFRESTHPETNGIRSVTRTMLPMPDGVELLTVSHIPDSEAPYHTIVQRTCYTIYDAELEVTAREYCKRGYAYVYQYCRGTGGSGGTWAPNVNEEDDGLATLAWLCARDWVRDIGYVGFSYMAYTGWAMAGRLPDKVRTMYLTHYGTDRYASAYTSGLFKMDLLTGWAMANAGFPVSAGFLKTCRFMPHVAVDEKLWGGRVDWYRDWVRNTSRSDKYWHTGVWKKLLEAPSVMDIPVYIGSGWFDHHFGGTVRAFTDLGPACRDASVLRVGGWSHFFTPCTQGYAGKNLRNSDTQSALDWFDRVLRRGLRPERKVSLYIIGADRWADFADYPVPPDYIRPLYLEAREDGTFGLEETEPDHATAGFDYDPENPVMSRGGEAMSRTAGEIGSLLQPDPGFRDDVLSFVSGPLDSPLTIIGGMRVRLFAASSADDTAFTVKIMEVMPDGKAYNIRTGIITLGYRQGEERRIAYTPGDIVALDLDTWDIAWQFRAGSRIRLDISSSDFPQYAVHSNYAGIWSERDRTRIARQTIYCGKQYPSCLMLPVKDLRL